MSTRVAGGRTKLRIEKETLTVVESLGGKVDGNKGKSRNGKIGRVKGVRGGFRGVWDAGMRSESMTWMV